MPRRTLCHLSLFAITLVGSAAHADGPRLILNLPQTAVTGHGVRVEVETPQDRGRLKYQFEVMRPGTERWVSAQPLVGQGQDAVSSLSSTIDMTFDEVGTWRIRARVDLGRISPRIDGSIYVHDGRPAGGLRSVTVGAAQPDQLIMAQAERGRVRIEATGGRSRLVYRLSVESLPQERAALEKILRDWAPSGVMDFTVPAAEVHGLMVLKVEVKESSAEVAHHRMVRVILNARTNRPPMLAWAEVRALDVQAPTRLGPMAGSACTVVADVEPASERFRPIYRFFAVLDAPSVTTSRQWISDVQDEPTCTWRPPQQGDYIVGVHIRFAGVRNKELYHASRVTVAAPLGSPPPDRRLAIPGRKPPPAPSGKPRQPE